MVDHLASQGSLTYDPRSGELYAVNAGSNTVSAFSVRGDHLTLEQVVSSGGTFPVSVAARGDLVYVANALGGGSVQGHIVCRQAVELVTDYVEGALSRRDRRRFEAHLAGCEHCTEYLVQIRATIRLSGRLGEEDLTPEMRADFVALYRKWRSEPE